jgi:hypothetical protein
MVAIGVALVWAGYTVGLWGYCLVQGYDVPFSGLFGKAWPGGPAASPAAPLPAADPGVGTFNV